MKLNKLMISVLALASIAPAMAQEKGQEIDSTDVFYRHLNLKEVVVTGATGDTRLKNSSAPVKMLTGREMQTLSSTNIVDAIASQPGVSQITTGSGIAKPVIRGLGYNRIVVVNDGIRQEGQQWGDEHGIEVDGQSVGSVEILKGPASLVYGSDAMAGVIKFNSYPVVPLGKIRLNLTSEYQTNNGLFDYSLNFAGNKQGILWDLRYSEKMAHEYKNRCDGYVPNSQFRERALRGMLGLNRSWGKSQLVVSHYHITPSIIEGERDAATGELEVPYEKLKTYKHGMPYQQVYHSKAVLNNTFYVGEDRLNVLLGYQQNRRQEFEEAESPDDYALYFKLHTVNYNVNYITRDLGGWKFTGGVNGMWQHSQNLGEEYLIPEYKLTDVGVFGTATREVGKWVLNGGLRFDHRHLNSYELIEDEAVRFAAIKKDFNGVTGSVGAVFHATDALNLKLNVSRGYRAPNVSELASNGVHEGSVRYELGNAGLKSEYSWQFDLSTDYASRYFSAEVALFCNRIDNYIYLHRVNEVIEEGYMTYRFDSGDARLLGCEVSLDVHPIHSLHLGTSFSMVDAVQLHQPEESKYLPFTPAPRWQVDAKYEMNHHGKLFCNSFISIGLDYNFKQNHYYKADDTETATPAYALLNAMVGTDLNVRGKHVASVYVIGSNLTDKVYQNHLNRLKYAPVNPVTGLQGVSNMGRNITFRVVVPLEF
ncbi:MAG: TonB-dependent receptor [Muribaculaceae bacterium]|nr:TonB-dependent receptor [Muribaculaceae bacterium]